MSGTNSSTLESKIAAALDWWRDAGVDATFTDEPRAWLAVTAEDQIVRETEKTRNRRPAEVETKPAPPARQIGGPPESWPCDLAAFREWWLTEPSLDEGGLSPRIAPVGEMSPDLMVLVAMPEEDDGETLLSGPHGLMLDGFLAAAGIPLGQAYRASVLPRHTALPDWPTLGAEGLGKVVAHHVSLVQPKRLLVLGRNVLPLCGHDPAQQPATLTFFHHENGSVPMLAEVGFERLLGKAQLRARLWKRWLDWTDG
jgi:DNA polymerase